MYRWDNHFFSVKLRQRFFCRMKTFHIHQILGQQYIQQVESLSPESKVSRFSMEAWFVRVVEVGQYFVTKDTGDFRQFRSVACREHTLLRGRSSFTTERLDQRKHPNWACIRSHDQLHVRQTWNWYSNLVCGSRHFSVLGQNILWNKQVCGRFKSQQHSSSCKIHMKNRRQKRVLRLLQPDQRQKQNHKRGNLLMCQASYRWMKENGLTLSHPS